MMIHTIKPYNQYIDFLDKIIYMQLKHFRDQVKALKRNRRNIYPGKNLIMNAYLM